MSRTGLIAVAGTAVVLLALIAGVTWLFLPIVQTLVYGIVVASPAMLWWIGVGIGFVALGAMIRSGGLTAFAFTVMMIMALVVGPVMSGIYAKETIQQQNDVFVEMDDLPETSSDHVRVVPRSVADEYASSSMQYPVYKLSDSDITYRNGTYMWSYGLIPDRFMVAWNGHQTGSMYVNMETMEKRVEARDDAPMQCGQGQIFTDSYAYKMNQKRLDVEHRPGTAFNFEHNGEPYIAQSYVTHEWHFRLTPIPQPYVVPKYGGTLVIDDECNVRDIPASEVPNSEILEGQNTYPYQLAMFYMKSDQLVHGVYNALFVGRDVPQVADMPARGNEQPFTIPTQNGNETELTYFIAAEPSGSGNGIYRIYTMDAQTGEGQVVEYDETQMGPEKAANFVRKERPEVNWASGDSGTMEVTELLPVVRDGTLYWKATVVPVDSSGIAYVSLVNAETGDVTTWEGVEVSEMDGSVNGSVAGNVTDTAPDGFVTIAIVDEDGNVVDTIHVPENGQVVISQNESESSAR